MKQRFQINLKTLLLVVSLCAVALFMFGIAGALTIWITMIVEGWRVDSLLNRGLSANGFSDDEIEHLRKRCSSVPFTKGELRWITGR